MDIQSFIRKIPKVELHRHLSGALSSSTMYSIAGKYGIDVEGGDLDTFSGLTSIVEGEKGFHLFLSKFKPRSRFYVQRDLITEASRTVVQEVFSEGVIHLDLRISSGHFARHMKFDFEEVTEQIISTAQHEADLCGMTISFIMTLTRGMPEDQNEELLRIVTESSLSGLFSGVDIAGDELGIPLSDWKPYLKKVRDKGLPLTIHAGEAGPGENVGMAIDEGAVRIGHGIRCFSRLPILKKAIDNNVAFEVCPTSNIHTDNIASISQLNLKELLDMGVRITINTDDPGISNVSLTDELITAAETFSLTKEDLLKLQLNAADAAFIGREQKNSLKKKIREGFAGLSLS